VKHLVSRLQDQTKAKLTRSVDIYHAYPLNQSRHDDEKNSSTAILFLTDFYGIASINNKL
jgi:hypothetical protein